MTSRRIDVMSPDERRAMLERILRSKVDGPSTIPLSRDQRASSVLTALQRRLWFFERLEPGSPTYNIGFRLVLDGALDRGALERSLGTVAARHEALRTRFREVDGEPVALVDAPSSIPLPVVDVVGTAAGDAEAVRLIEEAARTPFDLEQGPVVRALLVRAAARRHHLGITLHHIVSDGWSVGLLANELLRTYEAAVQGREPDLPPLPFQFRDYAAWEERWLNGSAATQQVDYWRERLAGSLPVVDLPADFDRPRFQTFRGGLQRRPLSTPLNGRVRELSRAQGATPFMTLLAAFSFVLHRLSGLEDLPVGTPVAGRNRAGTEQLIGAFINTVVIRSDFRGNPTFAELLQRTRSLALEAYRNADVPFDRVVDALNPRRDPGRTPLFQILVNYQESGASDRLELPDLAVELHAVEVAMSKFDLTLYLGANQGTTMMALSYNADLFRAARMEEMLSQFEQVLEAVTARPDRPLSELSLLTPSARAVLPDPAEPLGRRTGASIPRVMGARGTGQEARLAVSEPRGSLDYDALDRLSRGLATRLRAAGVGRGDVVALRCARSSELVWGLHGVLRAGAAFVVLDPAHPPERIAACLRTAAPKALLETPGLPDAGPDVAALANRSQCALHSSLEPTLFDGILLEDAEAIDEPGGDDLAYLAFTSGTTGGVKGIVGVHGPVAHFLDWHVRTFGLTSDDRFSMLSGLSHDPLLRDVFTPARLGASLHIPEADDILAPDRLRGWMNREGITVAHITPSLARVLTEGSAVGELPHLRWAFLGGDVLTRDVVRQLRRCAPGAKVVNFYGATETPQAMAWYVVPDESENESLPLQMPLGRGIDDVQILVLGPGERLAGVGETGEIVVRTPHLTRGYLGDEALTRERFVVGPFSAEPEDRLYRTGDVGRFRLDGSIDFVGRRDGQVKIRGFRVELESIEHVLSDHPGVRQAAVLVRRGRSGGDDTADPRLVAFVSLQAGNPCSVKELRDYVRRRLPDYQVPSSFVTLDALPLTPNGKVDRHLLGQTEIPSGDEHSEHVNPRTPTEEILAGIWQEVLGSGRIGVSAGFFDLGGHSLLATQVVSRVRDSLGVALPLRALFEMPTLADLARLIDHMRDGGRAGARAPLARVSHDGAVPLSFAQQRLWFLHELEPQSAAYNLAGALDLRGDLDVDALESALTAIVGRHESLRTAFRREEGQPVQVVLPPSSVTLQRMDLSAGGERRGRLDALIAEEIARPFDLESGSLLRASLYDLGDRERVLLFVAHHIVSDGWSMGVFARELTALYASFAAGAEPALPTLPIRYTDYAWWQREWLNGDALRSELEHWRARLDGAPRVLDLPNDRPRPPVETHRGDRLSGTFPGELGSALTALGRREGATLFMTLLAAFYVLLSRHAGQQDLLVGSPVANRDRAETESLIGFFANTLVLRGDLRGDPTFVELLKRVRDMCFDAYAHQEVPFERLVEELRPERDLARNPIFQVMFALQNVPESRLRLEGLEVSGRDLPRRAAQLDLTLFMRESEDGLHGSFEYATDLFDKRTIERLGERFRVLLEGIVADPAQRVSALPLLTPQEWADERSWNSTPCDLPSTCVHEVVRERAVAVPHRVAVECGEGSLTFGELEERAERLARVLRRQGVGPGVLVGVYMERGLDMLVALLGVWKAGGAYVPLDPGFPPDRLAYMVEDSGAALLLTQTGLEASVPTRAAPAIAVDGTALQSEPAVAGGLGSERGARPDDLAYVIYTSGSTGRPKGVAITHRALLNLLLSMGREPGLAESDVLLSVTTLSFDIAALELFLPLLVGARVYVASRDDVTDARRLIALLRQLGVTVMQATPVTWRMLIESGWEGSPGLKVLCGGEAMPRDLAEELLKRSSEVWNVYGPTETTVWSSMAQVESGVGPVSIGRAIANTQMWVLDDSLERLPVGIPGELYIGGTGLARGYWDRPDLTAEKFVPDPLSEEPGRRLYRTGDLARWLPDGRIECLGRIDHQVKVRGFRIELGEIEAVLRDCPGIGEAVVLAQQGVDGDQRLLAFLTGEAAAPVSVTELREQLRQTLPGYMVPSSFTFVDRLPLTPNGKVDRRALAGHDGARTDDEVRLPPRTEMERLVAEVWGELLGIEAIGVRDNFFNLGGHSLLAVRALSRIEARVGRRLNLREMMTRQTLEQFAAGLDVGAATTREPAKKAKGGLGTLVRGWLGGLRGDNEDHAT